MVESKMRGDGGDALEEPEEMRAVRTPSLRTMGKKNKNVYRFAVGSESSARSSIWRLWTQVSSAGHEDVYLGVRSKAGIFKVSFHGSGVCQQALSDSFASQSAVVDVIGEN